MASNEAHTTVRLIHEVVKTYYEPKISFLVLIGF